MARLTKWLPVTSIPKENRITSVWFYVIHYSSLDISAFFLADSTQRILSKKRFAFPLPSTPISTFPGWSCSLRVEEPVCFTILLTIWNQFRTARMLTRCLRSAWQMAHPFQIYYCVRSVSSIPVLLLLSHLQESDLWLSGIAVRSVCSCCFSNQSSLSFVLVLKTQCPAPFFYVRAGGKDLSPVQPRKKDSEQKLQVLFHFGNSNINTFNFEKQYTFSTPEQ